MKRGQPLP